MVLSMSQTEENLSAFLSTTQYFQAIDPADVEVLSKLFEVVHFGEGEQIFEEGDAGDGWYLIVSGEVAIARKGRDDKPPHTLAHLDAGEGFGEMALLENAARMAGARASEGTKLARLPREAFISLLEENNPAASNLLREMAAALCQRLREVTGILQDIVDNPEPVKPLPSSALDNLIRAMMAQN